MGINGEDTEIVISPSRNDGQFAMISVELHGEKN